MPGQRFLLVARDFRVAETREVVVTLVVLPCVIDAEAEILPLRVTPYGRTMHARLIAAIPLAAWRARFRLRLRVGSNANFLEIFRVGFHIGLRVTKSVWKYGRSAPGYKN